MAGHGQKISRNKERVIAALLSFPSIQEAAENAGVSESTVRRWLKDDHFTAAYRKARHQVVSQAIGKLQTNISGAIDVLMDIAENEQAPASARVTAARAIIDQSLKAVEVENVEERIERLEQIIEEKLS